MELNGNVIERFSRTKRFKYQENVFCTKYSPLGLSVSTSSDNKLSVYNTMEGRLENVINVDAQVFTYVLENDILYTSDRNIRLLSLYDNKNIFTFRSHLTKVKFISSSAVNDTFLSSSDDGVRMWDLGCRNPVYKTDILNSLSAFFDENFVICAGSLIHFYDTRNPTGPYKTVSIPLCSYKKAVSTRKHLCISSSNSHYIFDIRGDLVHSFKTEMGSHVDILPCSQYYMCSSGSLLFFTEIESKARVCTIKGDTDEFGAVEFNPYYAQFVSSDHGICFWMP